MGQRKVCALFHDTDKVGKFLEVVSKKFNFLSIAEMEIRFCLPVLGNEARDGKLVDRQKA
jgi:hypothetical protein